MANVQVSLPVLSIAQNGTTGNFGFNLSASPGSTTVITATATTIFGTSPGGSWSGGSAGTDTIGLTFTTGNFATQQFSGYSPPPGFIGHIKITVTNNNAQTNPVNGDTGFTNSYSLIVTSGTGVYTSVTPAAKGPNDASRTSSVVCWLDADAFPTGSIGGFNISVGGSSNTGAMTATVPAPTGGGTTATLGVVVAGGVLSELFVINPGSGYGVADDPIHVTFANVAGVTPVAVATRGNPGDQQTVGAWVSSVGATPTQFVQATQANQPVYDLNGGPSGAAALGWNSGTTTLKALSSDTALSAALAASKSYSITMIVRPIQTAGTSSSVLFSQSQSFANNAACFGFNVNTLRRFSGGPQYAPTLFVQASSPAGVNGPIPGELWGIIHYTYQTNSGGTPTSATGVETLYLNGQVVATSTGGLNNELWAGTGWFLAGSIFQGLIAQFVVDNVALTATQIDQDVAYWRGRYVNANTPTIVVFMGDSRTEGVQSNLPGTTIYPVPLQIQGRFGSAFPQVCRWLNAGIGGSTAVSSGFSWNFVSSPTGAALTATLTQFAPMLFPLYKVVFVVWYGVNSFTTNPVTDPTQPNSGWSYLYDLMSALLNHWGTVVLCTECDEKGGIATYNTWRTSVSAPVGYNQWILSTFGNTPNVFIARLDQNALIGPQFSSLNQAMFGPDFLHLKGEIPTLGAGPQGGTAQAAGVVAPVLYQAVSSIAAPSALNIVRLFNIGGA